MKTKDEVKKSCSQVPPHLARYSRHPPRFLGSDGPHRGPEIGLPNRRGPLMMFVFSMQKSWERS